MKRRHLCSFMCWIVLGSHLEPDRPYDTWGTGLQGQNSSLAGHGVGVVMHSCSCLLPVFSAKGSRQCCWKSTKGILQIGQSTQIELPPPLPCGRGEGVNKWCLLVPSGQSSPSTWRAHAASQPSLFCPFLLFFVQMLFIQPSVPKYLS